MPLFRGAGGVEWDLDVPREGTAQRELFDQQLARGDLVPVDGEPVASPEPVDEVTADEEQPEVEETSDPERPKGNAGRPAWAAYAESIGLEIVDGQSRDDIRAAVEAHEA